MMASDLIRGIPGYEDKFRAEEYLASFTISGTCSPPNAAFFKTFASMFHDVFSAHEPGHRLLDVGSGPTLRHLMSASAKYRYCTLRGIFFHYFRVSTIEFFFNVPACVFCTKPEHCCQWSVGCVLHSSLGLTRLVLMIIWVATMKTSS